jgi:hypothetical protein
VFLQITLRSHAAQRKVIKEGFLCIWQKDSTPEPPEKSSSETPKDTEWQRLCHRVITKRIISGWTPMAHACNPSYLRVRYRGLWLQASWSKKFMRPHLNRKKLCKVVYTCHPGYGGKHKIGGSWSRWKARPYFQNNQSKKDWNNGSSSRDPASLVRRPEFKPQCGQINKKINK